jgi:hypothetical protein
MRVIMSTIWTISCFWISLEAALTATVDIGIKIICLDSIAISGSPPPFILKVKEAGDPFSFAFDASTSYAVTTNNFGRSIYAALDRELPPGVELRVHLAPPCASSSWGYVPLSAANNRLVSGISQSAEGGLAISYYFTAEASLPPFMLSNIITYTIGP